MDALFKGQKKIVRYMYCMYITALSSDKLHNPLSTGNVKWPNNTELGIWDFRSENGASLQNTYVFFDKKENSTQTSRLGKNLAD